MSSIPPSSIGSVLQSPLTQQQQTKVDEAARTAREAAARRLSATSTEDILEIESTDGDTRVHTDAGGAGSQGRTDGGDEEAAEEKAEIKPKSDEGERPRLDVTA